MIPLDSPGESAPVRSSMRAPVCVVIPCFNAAVLIRQALESVFAQTLRPARIVVVDDGSTDDSARILASYGSRIEVLSQPNQGISAARNRGIAIAREPLVAFLDADDLWPSHSLQARLAALSAHPEAAIAYGRVESFVDAGVERRPGSMPVVREVQAGRLAGSLLVRRSAFEQVGLFDPTFSVGETMDWVARAQAAGLQMHGIAQTVLQRRIHGRNTMSRNQSANAEFLRILRRKIARGVDAGQAPQ